MEPAPPPVPDLLANRCRNLGHLLLAERAGFYVVILHRMLLFRREHELEPLYEDLHEATAEPLAVLAGGPYTIEAFRQDLAQLERWEHVTCRIERERLRGYRDTRRRKFRYRLADEAAAFLLWLEERGRDDLQPDDTDTRDSLEELVATLRETARLMNRPDGEDGAFTLDACRGIMYRLSRMSSLAYETSRSLGDLNARLLGFVVGRYDAATARAVIAELDHFLRRFLGRISVLRQEILPELRKLRHSRYERRWAACVAQMDAERSATSHLMRSRPTPLPAVELDNLTAFFAPDSQFDQLCGRVNQSALLVWRKLYTHLRELERRSHRLQDLQARIREMADLPPERTPDAFIRDLLRPAHMIGDMHAWSETEKAEPPQPRWEKHRSRTHTVAYLADKAAADGRPVRSLDEERLQQFGDWLQRAGLAPETTEPARASSGRFEDAADLARLLELARHGLLGSGARLRRLGYGLTPGDGRAAAAVDRQALEFREMLIEKARKSSS